MDFALTDAQQQIRDQVLRICAKFDDSYWLERDTTATFPHEFFDTMAESGWLGIAMPEAYGGSGLGITEAALMMQAVAESGAAMSGASAIHINIFGLNPVVVYGTEAQKQRMLPPLIATGTSIGCSERRYGPPPRRSRTRFCCWPAPRRWTRSSASRRA